MFYVRLSGREGGACRSLVCDVGGHEFPHYVCGEGVKVSCEDISEVNSG